MYQAGPNPLSPDGGPTEASRRETPMHSRSKMIRRIAGAALTLAAAWAAAGAPVPIGWVPLP